MADPRRQIPPADDWFPSRPRRFSGASAPNGRPGGIPPVPGSLPQTRWQEWLIQIARTLNLVLRGKMNATASVTLNPNATATVLSDSRIGPYSHVTLEAMTASAATARAAGLYIVPTAGSATINHPAAPLGDQTFSVLIIG